VQYWRCHHSEVPKRSASPCGEIVNRRHPDEVGETLRQHRADNPTSLASSRSSNYALGLRASLTACQRMGRADPPPPRLFRRKASRCRRTTSMNINSLSFAGRFRRRRACPPIRSSPDDELAKPACIASCESPALMTAAVLSRSGLNGRHRRRGSRKQLGRVGRRRHS